MLNVSYFSTPVLTTGQSCHGQKEQSKLGERWDSGPCMVIYLGTQITKWGNSDIFLSKEQGLCSVPLLCREIHVGVCNKVPRGNIQNLIKEKKKYLEGF